MRLECLWLAGCNRFISFGMTCLLCLTEYALNLSLPRSTLSKTVAASPSSCSFIITICCLALFKGEYCLGGNQTVYFIGIFYLLLLSFMYFKGISGTVISVFISTAYLNRSVKSVGNLIDGQKTAYISGLMRCLSCKFKKTRVCRSLSVDFLRKKG